MKKPEKREYHIRRVTLNETALTILRDLADQPELHARVKQRLAMVIAVADDLRGAPRDIVATAYAESAGQALEYFYATADEPRERRLLPGVYTAMPV